MHRFAVCLALLFSAALTAAQATEPAAPVEFRVGSLLLAGGAHLTTLEFSVVEERASTVTHRGMADLVVTGVTGPNGHPVPSGGAFPLDLSDVGGVTLRLHQPPQVGEYTATLTGGGSEFRQVVSVPELTPLEAATITRLDVGPDHVEVEWQSVPGALSYRVLALGPRGQHPVSEVVTEPFARLEGLAAGAYELLIEAYDYDAGGPNASQHENPRQSLRSADFRVQGQ